MKLNKYMPAWIIGSAVAPITHAEELTAPIGETYISVDFSNNDLSKMIYIYAIDSLGLTINYTL